MEGERGEEKEERGKGRWKALSTERYQLRSGLCLPCDSNELYVRVVPVIILRLLKFTTTTILSYSNITSTSLNVATRQNLTSNFVASAGSRPLNCLHPPPPTSRIKRVYSQPNSFPYLYETPPCQFIHHLLN